MQSKNKAQKQNPELAPFGVLIGEWNTTGTHPFLPGETIHGSAVFEWMEGGAFLIMHAHIEDKRFPDGIEIFASDDAEKKILMLHFDERGVSRMYDVSVENRTIRWQRDDSEFSQRMELVISDDGNTLSSKGEMNRNKKGWEPDLQLTYKRK